MPFTNTGRNLADYFIGGKNQLLGQNFGFTFQKDDYFFAYLTTDLGGPILRILKSNLIVTVIADGTTTPGSNMWLGEIGVTKLPFQATGYSWAQINDSSNSTLLLNPGGNLNGTNPNDVAPIETTLSPLVSHSSNNYNSVLFNVDSEILDLFKTKKVIRFFVDSYVNNSIDWGMVGLTATELKAAGFTATELKAAGFTDLELLVAGFNIVDLIPEVVSSLKSLQFDLAVETYRALTIENELKLDVNKLNLVNPIWMQKTNMLKK